MKTKVLIVDDEQGYLELLRDFLHARGFKVYCSREPFSSIDKCRRIRPDILLIDYFMPLVNGGELFKILRNYFPKTKVVFISGHPTSEVKSAPHANGADAYICKADGLTRVVSCLSNLSKK